MSQKLHNPKSFAPAVYIPCWLIQVPIKLLSHGAKMTYGRLSQWADQLGHAFRSAKQLGEEIGTSADSIEKYLKELRQAKLIGTYHPKAGGVNHFEFYDHPWMHEPIKEQLVYKHEKRNPPANLTAPSVESYGTPPPDSTDINNKEIIKIKKTKEIYKEKEIQPTCEPQSTGEEMLDTNYEYPDTYFKSTQENNPTKSLQPSTPEAQMKSLFSPDDHIKEQYGLSEEEFHTFNFFWDMYPRKINKIRAMHAWFSAGCHHAYEQILTKLMNQVGKDSSYLEGFSPAPVKYIEEQRWLDEITKKKKGTFDHDDCSWADSSRKSVFE